MVKALKEWHGYSIQAGCQLVDLPRSSYYYENQKPDEGQLEQDLKTVAGQFPRYGSRRLFRQLRRAPYGYSLGRFRMRRLMRQHNLLQKVKRKQYRTTNSDHPYPRYRNLVQDLEITCPDQVWVCDITYIRLFQEFVFLAVVMDVFTRSIRGWNLSKSLDTSLTLDALVQSLQDHVPEIHHSDQGVQYANREYVNVLQARQVQISMAAQGEPRENGYAERLMRTIKEEEVDLSDYQDFADAYRQIGRFLEDVYNTKRIHSSLGYLTPVEFEAAWQAQRSQLTSP
jgi:transposase InsO family protein